MRAGGGADCPAKVLRGGGGAVDREGGCWENVGGAHRCFAHYIV